MIEIILNGKPIMIEPSTSLAKVLQECGYQIAGFAVAINQAFVPRAQYATVILQQHDVVEIVAPMQGG